jgi:hypothetical protein
VFFVGSVRRGYKRAQSEDGTEYRTVVERSRVESSELAAAEVARKEVGVQRRLHVLFDVTLRVWQIRCQDTTSED